MTDTLEIISRNTDDNTLVPGYELLSVSVVNGDPRRDLAAPQTWIDTHTGGFEALKIIDEDGDPLEGATVRVFTHAEYLSSQLDNPIGITFTDVRGYWTEPVFLDAGATYVVLVHKSVEFGPVSVEVTV